tara:strand:+ start:22251 stop:22751 length:501 start_codon:yes stop_codon:yes gene_type:complete
MTRFQFAMLALWLSFTVLAFSYFINDKLKDFDADNKLANITALSLAPQIRSFLSSDSAENSIIHLSKKNCGCQATSEVHIQEINNIALVNHFNVINVVLEEHDTLPSTPSIAIINNAGEVIYYGPYGQGIACSQTAGYAQTVLKNYLKGYMSNIIIKEAKGCYCKL